MSGSLVFLHLVSPEGDVRWAVETSWSLDPSELLLASSQSVTADGGGRDPVTKARSPLQLLDDRNIAEVSRRQIIPVPPDAPMMIIPEAMIDLAIRG